MTRDWDDALACVEVFDTAEEAALAGWRSTPAAHPHVIDVQPADQFDGVYVTVGTDNPRFDHVDISVCVRVGNGKWVETGSSGG